MKNTVKKVLATALAVITCLSCAAVGTTVFAANAHKNLPAAQENVSTVAPLRDGVWQGVDENGDSDYYVVNTEEKAIGVLSPELNIGIPTSYTYDAPTGTYNVDLGSPQFKEVWTISDNSGYTATLTKSDGQVVTLYYLGEGTTDMYYSLRQLKDMAKNYYESLNGENDDIFYDAKLSEDGSGNAVIWVYSQGSAHNYTVDSYVVSVVTGAGHDIMNNQIDLSMYAM